MDSVNTSDWIPGTRYFTRITDTNHSGWLYIVTLLSLCYIIIVFAVRFVVKYGMYGQDDWALLVSTLLATAQHIALLTGLGMGMGKSATLLSHKQLVDVEKFTAAHVFLFILAHSVSKLSSALLTQRLFQNGRQRNIYLCWGLVGASVFYGVWAVLSASIACPDPAFPLGQNQCSNRYLRWFFIVAVDMITELMLVVVPCVLLLDVQIKRQAKTLVMAVFAVRLPDIILAGFTLLTLRGAVRTTDIGLGLVLPTVCSQVELLWSILAASVPCLKTFMRPFDQVDENTWRSNNDAYASQRSAGRSMRDPRDRDGAIALEEMKAHNHGFIGGSDHAMLVRPDKFGHEVTIAHAGADSLGDEHRRSRSWGSQERIIRAQTHWEVTRESEPRDPYAIP